MAANHAGDALHEHEERSRVSVAVAAESAYGDATRRRPRSSPRERTPRRTRTRTRARMTGGCGSRRRRSRRTRASSARCGCSSGRRSTGRGSRTRRRSSTSIRRSACSARVSLSRSTRRVSTRPRGAGSTPGIGSRWRRRRSSTPGSRSESTIVEKPQDYTFKKGHFIGLERADGDRRLVIAEGVSELYLDRLQDRARQLGKGRDDRHIAGCRRAEDAGPRFLLGYGFRASESKALGTPA